MSVSNWMSFFLSQLWLVPYSVVLVVGMILAIVRWQRHPPVSLMALLGCSLLLANEVMWALFTLWQTVLRNGLTNVEFVFPILRGFCALLNTVGFALLISAIFGWRARGDEFGKPRE